MLAGAVSGPAHAELGRSVYYNGLQGIVVHGLLRKQDGAGSISTPTLTGDTLRRLQCWQV